MNMRKNRAEVHRFAEERRATIRVRKVFIE
jgi:hypothetical protein